MKLAIICQRYTPFGGAERFIENALASKALALEVIDDGLNLDDWGAHAWLRKKWQGGVN